MKAGISKQIGWHTFRRSLGNLLKDQNADLKTVQELMRQSTTRVLTDIYLQRAALSHVSGIFEVPVAAS